MRFGGEMEDPQIRAPELKSPFSGPRADLGKRAKAADTVIVGVAVVAGLYFGRDVLVPIAIAVLLSFVLAPLVDRLVRLKLGRVASVLLSVAVAFAILISLGAIIGRQVAQLADNLPNYQSVIAKKLDSVKSSSIGAGVVEKAADALHGLQNASGSQEQQASAAVDRRMMQVEVHEPAPGPVQIVQSVLTALLPPLATAAVVIVFVVFILFQRQDLRDRLIGMVGSHDLHRTTQALDEAAHRLSRYFLALTGINAAFGVAIGIGLYFIGVPNPMLWGIVGAVLRFVPYIGGFIAVAIPLALAAAVDPGWTMVAETALLYIALEGLMGQVVEPHLFGHTTGMSPLAIIVAAAFWTLLWGTPGLLLSTPLTACLVVLGRHVETLNFIELILGDRPPLSPAQRFYQRVLASDPDEIAFQAEDLLKSMTLLEYYETVAAPALLMAQIDVTRGVMSNERQDQAFDTVEQVVASLAEYAETDQNTSAAQPLDADVEGPTSHSPLVLCIGGRTPLDQALATIAAQLIQQRGVGSSVVPATALTSAGIFTLRAENCAAICVFYLDHQIVAPVRYSLKRLQKKFATIPTGVCVLGGGDLTSIKGAAGEEAKFSNLTDIVEFAVKNVPTRAIVAPVQPLEAM
jgi:predicted PurR-regulated permease PerM